MSKTLIKVKPELDIESINQIIDANAKSFKNNSAINVVNNDALKVYRLKDQYLILFISLTISNKYAYVFKDIDTSVETKDGDRIGLSGCEFLINLYDYVSMPIDLFETSAIKLTSSSEDTSKKIEARYNPRDFEGAQRFLNEIASSSLSDKEYYIKSGEFHPEDYMSLLNVIKYFIVDSLIVFTSFISQEIPSTLGTEKKVLDPNVQEANEIELDKLDPHNLRPQAIKIRLTLPIISREYLIDNQNELKALEKLSTIQNPMDAKSALPNYLFDIDLSSRKSAEDFLRVITPVIQELYPREKDETSEFFTNRINFLTQDEIVKFGEEIIQDKAKLTQTLCSLLKRHNGLFYTMNFHNLLKALTEVDNINHVQAVILFAQYYMLSTKNIVIMEGNYEGL